MKNYFLIILCSAFLYGCGSSDDNSGSTQEEKNTPEVETKSNNWNEGNWNEITWN